MSEEFKIKDPMQRGEIRLELYMGRSSLMPQWWEARRRYRWWRLAQYVRSHRQKLSTETQVALAWAEEALEREFLFGNEDRDVK